MLGVNIFTPFTIPPSEIKVEERAILRLLGYDTHHVEPYISETIKGRIQQSFSKIIGRGGYLFKQVSSVLPKEGILVIDDKEFLVGKIIGHQLKLAEYLVFFVVTIGKELEELSEELFKQGEMLEGYIVNLIASEAAESAAAYLHNHVKLQAQSKGLNSTNRYSPGYCNWNVAEQFKLFNFFPENFKDVALTESALMKPIKSVSGIIGIGEKVKFNSYTCNICSDTNCIYRNSKSNNESELIQ